MTTLNINIKMRYTITVTEAVLQTALNSVNGGTCTISGTSSIPMTVAISLWYNVSLWYNGTTLVITFDVDYNLQSVTITNGVLATIEADGYAVYDTFASAGSVTQVNAGTIYFIAAASISNLKTSLEAPAFVKVLNSETNAQVAVGVGGKYVPFQCLVTENPIGVTSLPNTYTCRLNKVGYLNKMQDENMKNGVGLKPGIKAQQFAQVFLQS